MRRLLRAAIAALGLALLAPGASAQAIDLDGRLVDATTGAAVADGIVTVGGRETRIGANGGFHVRGAPGQILVRALGYRRISMSAADLAGAHGVVRLAPITPKGLYLTVYGVGSQKLLGGAMAIVAAGGANALVIDLKGDRGTIPYPSAVPLATTAGARKLTTIPDLAALVQRLHGGGIYVIARIVVFKDNPLAEARPDLAIRRGKALFRDREGLAWADPFQADVRTYNIDLAVEAAAAGVDEIQFDYLRFPDSSARLTLAQPSTQANRVAAIAGFLAEARQRLVPYNVFTAADIFGYVCWNLDDTGIGQRLEDIAPQVDYLSPMLYPSGYRFGIPGIRNPVANSYAIVHGSLVEAQRRLGGSSKRFRPWLQAFKDYAFDHRSFDADEVALQIRATQDFGSDGWMLWNANNVYADAGLVRKEPKR
ncbi:putative glycoside hydrolase [Sphingomonas oligophenolica]|uniref:Glycoside hydrolase n=1 Tax=Sphingomonas oligophenolica TaxID=301154 RepID=A0ABU9Y163_9SPHN